MKGAQVTARLERLGDQGLLARFDDEESALIWAESARGLASDWMLDVVQAYSTVAVFHDPSRIPLSEALDHLQHMAVPMTETIPGRLHRISCCYERGPDLARVAQHCGLTTEEVIRLHGSVEFRVYAIGFSPGFPYMGYLPEPLCGVPRLESPRLRVEPGSVGLTGRQTGIYPEAKPGGWCLIGQTPLVLVDVEAGFFPLSTGDRVQFVRIGEAEFVRRRGERLNLHSP